MCFSRPAQIEFGKYVLDGDVRIRLAGTTKSAKRWADIRTHSGRIDPP